MKYRQGWCIVMTIFLSICLWGSMPEARAETSSCEECHIKITPMQVKDFYRGKMSHTMTCKFCHGVAHTTNDDVEKAELPTIQTCRACHVTQVEQYLSGKHAKGLIALEAMPYTHRQPQAFIEGQKGCGAVIHWD